MNRSLALLQSHRVDGSSYSEEFTNKQIKNIFLNSENFSNSQYYNFSNFTKNIEYSGNGNWGDKISFTVNPGEGDFLMYINLLLVLPSLSPNGGTFASWTNTIGYSIFSKLDIYSGGQFIATMDSEALELLWAIKTEKDIFNSRNELVGRYSDINNLKNNALNENRYLIPIPLWFSEKITESLPLFASNEPWTFTFYLRNFDEVVNFDGEIPNEKKIRDLKLECGLSIVNAKIKHQFKNLLKKGDLKDLVTIPYLYKNTVIDTKFPSKEIFMVRRSKIAEDNNDWFNYSEFGTGKQNLDSCLLYTSPSPRD